MRESALFLGQSLAKGIEKSSVGISMSTFAFAFLCTTIFTGKFLLQKIKRFDACIIGTVIQILCFAAQGFLKYCEDKDTILYLTWLFMALSGIANGMVLTATMAILSSHKQRRQEFIEYFEIATSLSISVGPVMGAIFYIFLGYFGVFEGLGITLLIVLFIAFTKRNELSVNKEDQKGKLSISETGSEAK